MEPANKTILQIIRRHYINIAATLAVTFSIATPTGSPVFGWWGGGVTWWLRWRGGW